MYTLPLPPVLFIAGKKKSGKDFLADTFVTEFGYAKLHIAEPWLRAWFAAKGLNPDEWETLKTQHRTEIQKDAQVARDESGGRALLVGLHNRVEDLLLTHEGVAVSGVRFINEGQFAMQNGYFVVRVDTGDETRRQRFIDSEESLKLFDDPFEHEVNLLPCHIIVSGEEAGWKQPYIVATGYSTLMRYRRA